MKHERCKRVVIFSILFTGIFLLGIVASMIFAQKVMAGDIETGNFNRVENKYDPSLFVNEGCIAGIPKRLANSNTFRMKYAERDCNRDANGNVLSKDSYAFGYGVNQEGLLVFYAGRLDGSDIFYEQIGSTIPATREDIAGVSQQIDTAEAQRKAREQAIAACIVRVTNYNVTRNQCAQGTDLALDYVQQQGDQFSNKDNWEFSKYRDGAEGCCGILITDTNAFCNAYPNANPQPPANPVCKAVQMTGKLAAPLDMLYKQNIFGQ